MGNEESSVTEFYTQAEAISVLFRQAVTSAMGTFFALLIIMGLFASCSLSIGWEAGQRISEGLGIRK